MNTTPLLTWSENDAPRSALWRSDQVLPKQVVLADDTMTADTAFRLACAGTGLLWRSDFQNARQLLQALSRRIDKPKKVRTKKQDPNAPVIPGAAFHTHRQAQAQRTRILSQVLIEQARAKFRAHLRRKQGAGTLQFREPGGGFLAPSDPSTDVRGWYGA